MSSELLLIFLVAFIVFGPARLPMLARHLGALFHHVQGMKQKLNAYWQAQLQQQQLQDNERKAEKADEIYREKPPQ